MKTELKPTLKRMGIVYGKKQFVQLEFRKAMYSILILFMLTKEQNL